MKITNQKKYEKSFQKHNVKTNNKLMTQLQSVPVSQNQIATTSYIALCYHVTLIQITMNLNKYIIKLLKTLKSGNQASY